MPKKLDVNENGGGCEFKPELSATDDHGFWGGPAGKPSCPSATVYRRKEKIEIDLWHWYRAWVRRGRVFSCHSFSHSKCQLIGIGPGPGISEMNLPFHAQTRVSTFRCPGRAVHHRIHPDRVTARVRWRGAHSDTPPSSPGWSSGPLRRKVLSPGSRVAFRMTKSLGVWPPVTCPVLEFVKHR